MNRLKNQIIQLHKQGFSLQEIAKKVGCHKQTVRYHLIESGCIQSHSDYLKQRDSEVVRMYHAGLSVDHIAVGIKSGHDVVYRILKKMKLDPPQKVKCLDLSKKILSLHSKGLSPKEISTTLSCAELTVTRHLRKNNIQLSPKRKLRTSKKSIKKQNPDEIITIELHRQGLTVTEMAIKCKQSIPKIRYHLRKYSIKPNTKKPPPTDVSRILQYHEEKYTALEIARRIGISSTTVRYHLKKNNLTPHRSLDGHARHRLILNLHEEGFVRKEIAKRAGCTPETVTTHLRAEGKVANKKVNSVGLRKTATQINAKGKPSKSISRKLGSSKCKGTKLMPPLNIVNRRRRNKKFITLFKSGLSIHEVAERSACSYNTVRNHLIKVGLYNARTHQKKTLSAEILRCNDLGYTQNEIAKKIGCSITTVKKYSKQMNLIPHAIKDRITSLSKGGVPSAQIAEQLGCSERRVLTIQRRIFTSAACLSEKRGRKRIDAQEINRILAVHKQGLSNSEIANQLGFSRSAIWKVIKENNKIPNKSSSDAAKKRIRKNEILNYHNKGLDPLNIASEMSLSEGYIRKELKLMHIKPHANQASLTKRDCMKEQVVALHMEGFTVSEILQRVNRSRSIIFKILTEAGLRPHRKNFRSYTTQNVSLLITDLYNQGQSIESIAHKLKMTPLAVFKIIKKNN